MGVMRRLPSVVRDSICLSVGPDGGFGFGFPADSESAVPLVWWENLPFNLTSSKWLWFGTI